MLEPCLLFVAKEIKHNDVILNCTHVISVPPESKLRAWKVNNNCPNTKRYTLMVCIRYSHELFIWIISAPSKYSTWDSEAYLILNFKIRIILTLTALKYLCLNHGDQRVFQFKIIINVLVSSFWFIWIPICYGCAAVRNILILSVRGPTLYVRIWRIKLAPDLKGSAFFHFH